jgi:hypothetical protein
MCVALWSLRLSEGDLVLTPRAFLEKKKKARQDSEKKAKEEKEKKPAQAGHGRAPDDEPSARRAPISIATLLCSRDNSIPNIQSHFSFNLIPTLMQT